MSGIAANNEQRPSNSTEREEKVRLENSKSGRRFEKSHREKVSQNKDGSQGEKGARRARQNPVDVVSDYR